VKPLLVASLAVNLLFAGGVAASVWRHHHGFGHGDRASRGEFPLLGFVRDLPADRQQAVRDQLMAARDKVQPLRKDVRDAWDASNSILTVEPFDKAKAKEAVTRLLDAESKFKLAVTDVLLDTAEKLTPEERRKLQEWRERRRPGAFGRHKPDRPGEDN
jgi:uncharacterized membrane protein